VVERRRYVPRVGEIVTRVMGTWSLEHAAERLGFALSRTPLADLKRGKIGREDTLRTFAGGMWERICEHYGQEVRERFGRCDEEAASDWLAEIAGFGLRHQTIQPTGAQEGSAEDDLLAVARLAVDEYVRRAERPLVSNRDRLAAWVLEMAEKYPHCRSLQVALRAGLEKLHEQPAEALEHDLGVWEAVLREEEENEANERG
jgi:hypothetical protein